MPCTDTYGGHGPCMAGRHSAGPLVPQHRRRHQSADTRRDTTPHAHARPQLAPPAGPERDACRHVRGQIAQPWRGYEQADRRSYFGQIVLPKITPSQNGGRNGPPTAAALSRWRKPAGHGALGHTAAVACLGYEHSHSHLFRPCRRRIQIGNRSSTPSF